MKIRISVQGDGEPCEWLLNGDDDIIRLTLDLERWLNIRAKSDERRRLPKSSSDPLLFRYQIDFLEDCRDLGITDPDTDEAKRHVKMTLWPRYKRECAAAGKKAEYRALHKALYGKPASGSPSNTEMALRPGWRMVSRLKD